MCGVELRYNADRENVVRICGVRDPTVKSVVSHEAWQRLASSMGVSTLNAGYGDTLCNLT